MTDSPVRSDVPTLREWARQLRLDASGENGRMSATAMYALADWLTALPPTPAADVLTPEPAPQTDGQEPTEMEARGMCMLCLSPFAEYAGLRGDRICKVCLACWRKGGGRPNQIVISETQWVQP